MLDCSIDLEKFIKTSREDDEMFKFFDNTLKDWTVYMLLYYSIRTGDFRLRQIGKIGNFIFAIYISQSGFLYVSTLTIP